MARNLFTAREFAHMLSALRCMRIRPGTDLRKIEAGIRPYRWTILGTRREIKLSLNAAMNALRAAGFRIRRHIEGKTRSLLQTVRKLRRGESIDRLEFDLSYRVYPPSKEGKDARRTP